MQMLLLPFLLVLTSGCVVTEGRAMDETEVEMTEQCISSAASAELLQTAMAVQAADSPRNQGLQADQQSKPAAEKQKASDIHIVDLAQTQSAVTTAVEDQAMSVSPRRETLDSVASSGGIQASLVSRQEALSTRASSRTVANSQTHIPGATHDHLPSTIDDATLSSLGQLLTNAAALEINATSLDASSLSAQSLLATIETLQETGENVAEFVTGAGHDSIIRAINEVEIHESVATMVASGEEVTSEMLRQVDGAERDLETVRHPDPGSKVVGDMITANTPPGNGATMLQANKRDVTLWPGGSVPYCFEPSLHDDVRVSFLEVISSISSIIPCVTFHEVAHVHGTIGDPDGQKQCDADHAVFLQSHPTLGCNAHVGVTPLAITRINIEPGGTCVTHGVMEHEIGHALGMYHEHQRPDREQYVHVNESNVNDISQYEILADASTAVEYDHVSLMHYRGSSANNAIDPSYPVIESIDASKQALMGQRGAFTQLDVEQLASMYGCSGDAEVCSPYGVDTCSSAQSCVCSENKIKVSVDINGQACEVCAQECLMWPEASSYEPCQCPSTLVKKVSNGKVNGVASLIYSCATPDQLHCPESGLCTSDSSCTCPPELTKRESSPGCYTCQAPTLCPGAPSWTNNADCFCGAEEVKKSIVSGGVTYWGCRPEFEECSTSGCTTDDTCICTGGKQKRTLTTTSGGVCYGCRDPCPATPGSCSEDFSCGCLDGQTRTLVFLPSGVGCLACRSAPVTQYGCACQQSWSSNGYGSDDYCDPVGSGSICVPVDPSCEPTGTWYGWCAKDY